MSDKNNTEKYLSYKKKYLTLRKQLAGLCSNCSKIKIINSDPQIQFGGEWECRYCSFYNNDSINKCKECGKITL